MNITAEGAIALLHQAHEAVELTQQHGAGPQADPVATLRGQCGILLELVDTLAGVCLFLATRELDREQDAAKPSLLIPGRDF